MKNKKLLIVVSSFILSLSACNADTSANTPSVNKTTTVVAADPVPQSGGYSNIDNAKLVELLKSGVTLIDIRRQEEWQQTGVVEGSKTITFFDNMGQINPKFLPEFTAITNPDKPVMLICRTGSRTQAASGAIAEQLGYKKVYNVTHGITGWIAEKRPVVKYK